MDEQLLPIANVGRMMRRMLPGSAKVSKEGKQTMQECATEFISFVTAEASEKCHKENRKTLSGDDICWALGALGFDNYADAMIRYLHKYREMERERAINSLKIREGAAQDLDHELAPAAASFELSIRVLDHKEKEKISAGFSL